MPGDDRGDVGERVVVDHHEGGSYAFGHVAKLVGFPRGHGGDHHRPGLQDPEPAGHGPRTVQHPEHHAVPGHDPVRISEHAGELIRAALELAVAPGFPVRDEERGAVRPEALDGRVDECLGGVEAIRVVEFGQRELKRGPGVERRERIASEGVDVRAGRELHCWIPSSEVGASVPLVCVIRDER